MAFVAYHDTVTDSDVVAFAGASQVLFVAIRLVTLGDDVRRTEPLRTDHILRAGWVSLGDVFDINGGGNDDYWREPIWADFPNTLWTPIVTNVGAGLDPATVVASRVRYSFSPGTEAEVYIFAL